MRERQVILSIADPLLGILEKIESDLRKINPETDLSTYILACLLSLHEDSLLPTPEHLNITELADLIGEEAKEISKEARLAAIRGDITQSRTDYLRAASLEIESMSYLPEMDPMQEVQKVMHILRLLKTGLGFKAMPIV